MTSPWMLPGSTGQFTLTVKCFVRTPFVARVGRRFTFSFESRALLPCHGVPVPGREIWLVNPEHSRGFSPPCMASFYIFFRWRN